MAERPPEMLKGERGEDQVFAGEEFLFRRVRPQDWDAHGIGIDAIELPDMSVGREKYGKAEWLLLDEEYQNWGVVGFQVHDLPSEMQHLGAFVYRFRPVHVPLKRDYPHSEVRVFESPVETHDAEKHVSGKEKLPPEFHLRWRRRLLRKLKLIIPPPGK